MSEVKNVNLDNFKEAVLDVATPVLVEFWAPWCGPCKALAPILDQIAEARVGSLDVVKVNIDENPELASRYGVSSIPNMRIFLRGEEVGEILGAQPKGVLLEFIDGYTR